MLTSQIISAIDDSIRTGDLISQPQVNTEVQMSNRLSCIDDLAFKVHIPSPSSILGEAASFDDTFDRMRQPKAKTMAAIRNGITFKPNIGPFDIPTSKGN